MPIIQKNHLVEDDILLKSLETYRQDNSLDEKSRQMCSLYYFKLFFSQIKFIIDVIKRLPSL